MPGDETLLAVLAVEDSDPGLNRADCQRLCGRFPRVFGNGERCSSKSASGLGWFIVQRIAAVQELLVDVVRSVALARPVVREIYDE